MLTASISQRGTNSETNFLRDINTLIEELSVISLLKDITLFSGSTSVVYKSIKFQGIIHFYLINKIKLLFYRIQIFKVSSTRF